VSSEEIGVVYFVRQACVLLVLGVTVYVFPAVSATPRMLWSSYVALVNQGESLRSQWRAERAGENVLPAKVKVMLALLRDNHVETFRYSDGIARDPEESTVQRLSEGAYPIRLASDAHHLLLLPKEVLEPPCRAVSYTQEAVLAYCP
jgi:hypothetical protein